MLSSEVGNTLLFASFFMLFLFLKRLFICAYFMLVKNGSPNDPSSCAWGWCVRCLPTRLCFSQMILPSLFVFRWLFLGSAFGEGIKNVFGALSLKFMRHETKNEASALFCSFSFFFAKVWLDDGVLKANHSQLDRTVGSGEGKITHTRMCVFCTQR